MVLLCFSADLCPCCFLVNHGCIENISHEWFNYSREENHQLYLKDNRVFWGMYKTSYAGVYKCCAYVSGKKKNKSCIKKKKKKSCIGILRQF